MSRVVHRIPNMVDERLEPEEVQTINYSNRWVRVSLVLVSLLILGVFVVATFVRPYQTDPITGEYVLDEQNQRIPLRMGSHTSIGLGACRFKELFDIPCPSCGMTTSFAMFVRMDFINALRANWVGTLLAAICLTLIPWGILSAVRGKLLIVKSIEGPLAFLVGSLTVLMLLRWGLILTLEFF